jgi:hypothetical protein
MMAPSCSGQRLGLAWLALTCAFALHVLDEALSGFLPIYNATVLALRAKYSWFPMPTFAFPVWLGGLVLLIAVMFALSPLFFRSSGWVRPIGYFMAVINVLNALGHTTGTILGRTVSTIHFARPAPGFYSSPFLFAASVLLLVRLRQSGKGAHRSGVSAGK